MSVLLTYVTEVFSSTNSDISPQHASTITTIMVMIGSLIFMNLVERINRRTLYICSASATALGLTLFAVYLHFLADNAAFNWFPVVCVPCVLFANCLGLAPVTWLVILEIMPKKVRYEFCKNNIPKVMWLDEHRNFSDQRIRLFQLQFDHFGDSIHFHTIVSADESAHWTYWMDHHFRCFMLLQRFIRILSFTWNEGKITRRNYADSGQMNVFRNLISTKTLWTICIDKILLLATKP